MPRLTDATYLEQRHFLVEEWQNGGHAFAHIRATEQWALHGFYCPADPLSDEEAVAYRRETTAELLSLPHRAGKAYVHLLDEIDRIQKMRGHARAPLERIGRKPIHHLRVYGEVRPKPNYELLAKALIEHVRSLPSQDEDVA